MGRWLLRLNRLSWLEMVVLSKLLLVLRRNTALNLRQLVCHIHDAGLLLLLQLRNTL